MSISRRNLLLGTGAGVVAAPGLAGLALNKNGIEIRQLGLDRWDLRFEPRTLPITFSLSPSGHFFLRIVLGYASYDSTEWKDIASAQALVRKMFEQRYPQIAEIGLMHGWHGITGHTAMMKPIAGPVGDGNIHVSVAYNGLGAMPAHKPAIHRFHKALVSAGVDVAPLYAQQH